LEPTHQLHFLDVAPLPPNIRLLVIQCGVVHTVPEPSGGELTV
jgi:hypothetical protein